MPTQARNKHLFIDFLPHGPHPFNHSTENGRPQSNANGHQSAHYRADILFLRKSNHIKKVHNPKL